jgi:hypothetical protein
LGHEATETNISITLVDLYPGATLLRCVVWQDVVIQLDLLDRIQPQSSTVLPPVESEGVGRDNSCSQKKAS